MDKQSIDKFLKFFANFDWYRFKEMCTAVANGDEFLADHLYAIFSEMVNKSSRVKAGVDFWFRLDGECQSRLVEFIDKNYGTPLK